MFDLVQHPANQRPLFAAPVDIVETAGALILWADLPGVAPEQCEIVIEQRVLRFFGRTITPVAIEFRRAYQEILPGDFYRSFILPAEVDTNRIVAQLENGVLRIELPKIKVS